MPVFSTHPEYDAVIPDYDVMRDCYAGERRIKEQRTAYLPYTRGQVKDGAGSSNAKADGNLDYDNYLARAQFPEFVKEAVNTLVGVMCSNPAVIKLPMEMQPLLENATDKAESLQMLLRSIFECQLLEGRTGLLADFPTDPTRLAARGELPHIVQYMARRIINWDAEPDKAIAKDRLNLVVLDESRFARQPGGDLFAWTNEKRYRVLTLDQPRNDEGVAVGPATYKTYVDLDGTQAQLVQPAYYGRSTEQIPFVFIGANDLDTSPDEIPLLPLARLALAIYRGEADYRHALHMQGQDTLVIMGDEIRADGASKEEGEPTETGAGAVIRIAAGDGADAKYIGVESKGISEQRQALTADRLQAQSMGARLLEPRGSQAESGEALQIRVKASTASLQQIALTAAAGLERILRLIAEWMGLDPSQVVVEPNLDFSQETPSPEATRSLGEATKTGIPLSERSMHAWMRKQNITKMGYEEERALREAEAVRAAVEQTATPEVGLTEPADGHDHEYRVLRWPDGSVRGTTSVDDDHFHRILEDGKTEEVDGHTHKLKKAVPVPELLPEEEAGGPPKPGEKSGEGKPDPKGAKPPASPEQ